MRAKDYFFLACGGAVFFIGSPLVMFLLDRWWSHVPFLPSGGWGPAVGAFSSAVGIFFCLWANVELIRRGNGAAAVIGPIKLTKETEHLVTTGPYALCRNPMHLGIMLYQLGLSCAINSLWTLIVPLGMLCFAYILACLVDEPRLQRDFPEAYAQWAQQTPRFLPRIK